MANLGAQSKGSFYPTSVTSIQKVINKAIAFKEKKEVFALDCCAGEGEAIEMIGKEYNCKTFAVELNENRAKKAAAREITKVLNTDALSGARKSNGWVGLNFLNPPYDISVSGTRLEIDFVERWGLTTAVGGVMILVINSSSANESMAKALKAQGYRPMYSFYDSSNEDYIRFGQFFIVLQKQMPSFRAAEEKFMNLFENPIEIDSDFEVEKISIKTGVPPQLFKEIDIPRWKIEDQLLTSRLKKIFFDELKSYGLNRSAIMHPNEGQSALLIASGALNKSIKLSNGSEVIFKGSSTKYKKDTPIANSNGDIATVKRTDAYKTVVYGLDLTHGQYVKYN